MSHLRNDLASRLDRFRLHGTGRGTARKLRRGLLCGAWTGILGGAITAAEVLYGPPPVEAQNANSTITVEATPTEISSAAAAPEYPTAPVQSVRVDATTPGLFPTQVGGNSDSLLLLQQEKERCFLKVQGQILELGRRWNSQTTGTVAQPAGNASASHAPPENAAVGSAQTPAVTQTASEPGAPSVPTGPGVTASTAATATEGGAAGSEGASGDALAIPATPEVLVEGPIDRLGIADSLFATGHMTAAARMYSEIDLAVAPTAERAWVQYQLAACDRRSGRIEAAQQRYRELIAMGEPGWLVDLARWWLQAIDDRKRLSENAARLTDIVQQLSAEVTSELQLNAGSTAGADSGVRR